MYGTTSPGRQDRSFNRDQPTHAAGSRSPVSANNGFGDRFPAAQRPQTAALDGQREPSSSRSSQQGGYYFQPYSSPYVAGKKNNNFINPNLVSSNVFYDHNYGYKNALPNDRLLSPVRGDRQDNRNRQNEETYNRDDRGPLTPQKVRRADVSEDRFTRTQGFGPRRLETADEGPSRKAQQRSVDSRLPREQELRKNSGLSQNDGPQRNEKTFYYGEEEQQQGGRARKDKGDEIRPTGPRGNKNDAYTIRDDRSEASTIVSTLSSDGYVCPKCLNKHMANGRRTACMASKRDDQERERRIQDANRQYHDDELARQRDERARRLQESRNVKNKLDNEYNSRLENRRSPARDQSGNNLNNLFGKQDEMKERQKAVSDMFRTQLKEQIKTRDEDKEREKKSHSQLYNTSLNIGTGYYNRYLDDPDNVRYKLQEQIDEKNYKQQRERETDKKAAQALHDQAMRNLEQEDRFRREKQWNQKRELQDAYWRASDDKKNKEREYMENKEMERQKTEYDYLEYKRRQQEEEAKTKSRLFDFKQGLMNQLGQSSYKKMYEEKRQQKDVTSFDPKSRTKKKYPCGECTDLYEKPYLTKVD